MLIYALVIFAGAACGAVVVYALTEPKNREARAKHRQALDALEATAGERKELDSRRQIFEREAAAQKKELQSRSRRIDEKYEAKKAQLIQELHELRRQQDSELNRKYAGIEEAAAKRELEIAEQSRRLDDLHETRTSQLLRQHEELRRQYDEDFHRKNARIDTAAAKREIEFAENAERLQKELAAARRNLDEEIAQLEQFRKEFSDRAISYTELQSENALLKREQRILEIAMRKLKLDRDQQTIRQDDLESRCSEVATRYLRQTERWIDAKIGSNNYTSCRQQLVEVIEQCESIGVPIPADKKAELLADLKRDFEKAVRAALEREEQARIKARIREEQALERERQKEIEQAELQKQVVQEALDRALAQAQSEHDAEVEALRARLVEAEGRFERAISMAQLTKAGHVYVISNLGSFGDGVFKIGMTRRLEPRDRVRELASASVPFPFDVHMMISCQDAPRLENALHRTLHHLRINRINPRKEFFRTDIETIRSIVEENHGVVEYVADTEALEYRQSLDMPEEDQAFIDQVYESLTFDDGEPSLDEELT